jgi:hypothetical protein
MPTKDELLDRLAKITDVVCEYGKVRAVVCLL